MSARLLALFAFLSFGALAATPGNFLLGQDYREWLPPDSFNIMTDKTGAIYVLSSAARVSDNTPPSLVTKLSPDGKTLIWQNRLGLAFGTMAVDPNGSVYVAQVDRTKPGSVSKLNDSGSGLAWTQQLGSDPSIYPPILAAGASGLWITGRNTLVHFSADGTRGTTVPLTDQPASMVVDSSGSALLTIVGTSGTSLERISPDGTIVYQTGISTSRDFPTVALDTSTNPSGNPVVYAAGIVTRIDANGAILSSKPIVPAFNGIFPAFGLDAAGNAYMVGAATNPNGAGNVYYPAKNSLATCSASFLTVAAPDGSILQTTYLQGSASHPRLTTRPDGSVLLADASSTAFAPTRPGPFPDAGTTGSVGSALVQFSPNANAQTFPLVCSANGASFVSGDAISPGEVFTLFGTGLGPIDGAQANVEATLPKQLADVQVTFDGVPAPLIWAQDSQINLVTPWALQPGTSAKLCVTRSAVVVGCLTLPVQQVTPGIFATPDGYAVGLNQDGSVNSKTNSAAAGSLVSVFATGLGPITPAQPDGSIIGLPLPRNTLPIGAMVGVPFPIATETQYAGPAPYRPAGISQINFRVGGAIAGVGVYLISPG